MPTESPHLLLIRALALTLHRSDEAQPISYAFLTALQTNLFVLATGTPEARKTVARQVTTEIQAELRRLQEQNRV